ncbi:DNA-binding protein H-NS [Paraburkholderia bannensis]|uniref:DNA-binding protein H-NS n=1 Tax=Paraburkholderia bannensis TaxID=765414 RepID=A0A7W9TVE1_9BURK|nr:DNA-binding protein H-NS [Paraburkholderia sp. WP4_3_2]MBB6102136.1 DNA-binding protein H-NS [Paraburkholderia bannensis]
MLFWPTLELVKSPPFSRDSATGKKWSGKGARPKWLVGKCLDEYAIDAPQPQA